MQNLGNWDRVRVRDGAAAELKKSPCAARAVMRHRHRSESLDSSLQRFNVVSSRTGKSAQPRSIEVCKGRDGSKVGGQNSRASQVSGQPPQQPAFALQTDNLRLVAELASHSRELRDPKLRPKWVLQAAKRCGTRNERLKCPGPARRPDCGQGVCCADKS